MRWSLKDLEEWLLIGSTLVEGSTLSEAEARDVLAGSTVSGHPVSEARELLNYRAATAAYAEFQQIHPFEDGNGRIGRILVAYFLHWKGGLAFRFVAADRLAHLRAIESSDEGDLEPLTTFIATRTLKEE